MSDTVQRSESIQVDCYLCNLNMPKDKGMEVPLTSGGVVIVHPSCMEFYMSQTSTAGGGCGSCTGGKGCC
jgi:hypothetical protein